MAHQIDPFDISLPHKSRSKRHPYKMTSSEEKQRAIEYAQRYGIQAAAETWGVTQKNLKRWIEVGSERKKGGGTTILK